MSNSSEIWDRIKQVVTDEKLIESEELDKIDTRIKSGRINTGDWQLAIENTLLKEKQNA